MQAAFAGQKKGGNKCKGEKRGFTDGKSWAPGHIHKSRQEHGRGGVKARGEIQREAAQGGGKKKTGIRWVEGERTAAAMWTEREIERKKGSIGVT